MLRALVFLVAIAASASAWAQTSLSFDVKPVPIIDVTIGGRAARLEIVPDISGQVFIGRDSARRLGIRTVPYPRAIVRPSDGDGAIRSQLGIQRVGFASGAEGPRVIVTPMEPSAHADGVIGLAAVPFDVIVFNLRAAGEGEREISFALATAQSLFPRIVVADTSVWLQLSFSRNLTVFNRTAAQAYDRAGHLVVAGDLVAAPVFPGLSQMVQPVRTGMTIDGLPLGAAAARTNSPLFGPIGPDDIIVEGQAGLPPPGLLLGSDALSRCSSVRIDRPARQFSLRCAAG